MSPELRLQRFGDLFNHLTERTAERRRTNRALRATLWPQLFSLATTPGQLEQLAEKFPRWRENGREFATRDGDMFIRE